MDLDVLARKFEVFATQAKTSSLYEKLARFIVHEPEILSLAAQVREGQQAPNLLFAAVHALLLKGLRVPEDERLARYYPSLKGSARDEGLGPAFRDFCLLHRDEIRGLVSTRLVQTNEVRRCALLLPAFFTVSLEEERPLALIEIGPSAGLNLLWDHYRYDYGEGRVCGAADAALEIRCEVRGAGRPPIKEIAPRVSSRVGLDLNPVDLLDAEQVLWLKGLVWPDQPERMLMLERAIAVTAAFGPRMLRGNALALLHEPLESATHSEALCVYHSHTLSQFSSADRQQLHQILAAGSSERRIHRISLEWIGTPTPELHHYVYEKGQLARQQLLALCEAHGAWLDWRL